MKEKGKKDTENTNEENTHPIRKFFGLKYERWVFINGEVEKAIAASHTWSEVLRALSQNGDLVKGEYLLAGAIFGENMFRKKRIVPPGCGVSSNTTIPIPQSSIRNKVVEFPRFTVIDRILDEPYRGQTFTIAGGITLLNNHLAEVLSLAYSKYDNNVPPEALTCCGFLVGTGCLISCSNSEKWTDYTGTDPEWVAEALS